MASLEVFNNKLNLLIGSLDEIVLDAMDTAAMDSIALLQRRLQEKGVDSDGNAWRPYSESYEKYKEKMGKAGNGLVNFTYRDRMLNNIGIVSATKGQIVRVVVRPRSEENQEKMQGLSWGIPAGTRKASKRKTKSGVVDVKAHPFAGTQGRGRIMSLSVSEETIVKRVFMENVLENIKTVLQ